MNDQPWWRGVDPGHRLTGKRAFVTGAGTAPGGDLLGIGEAIAVLFASQGASVAVADISAERAAATVRLINEVDAEGVAVVGDLSSEADNARCVGEAVRALGGLDIVVNNVALSGGGGSPVTADLEVWERVMAVNVRAAMLTARHAIPHLQHAGGGSIINVSSVAATRALGAGAYAASKAAIAALTRDWALIHGRDHIRVNCIVVGHACTPMGATDQAGRERRRLASLLGTEGLAWDIAWPAVFLASEESRWITGVDLPVDAGATATTALGIQLLNQSRALQVRQARRRIGTVNPPVHFEHLPGHVAGSRRGEEQHSQRDVLGSA
jgi:NAD(P)-dependent dehydrogenase (short-subunit alcohol dehydrogenase family)